MPETYMVLAPEPDISAYDLWRCLMLGDMMHKHISPEDVDSIPTDLRRHYKPRSVDQY